VAARCRHARRRYRGREGGGCPRRAGNRMTSALPLWARTTPWGMLAAVVAVGGFGLIVLYSAAGGAMHPWAMAQGVRFAVLLVVAIALAQLDPKLWLKHAYLFYAAVLIALVGVEALGAVSGGSRRWLDTGNLRLQPSEFMKLAIVLALARYFHKLPRSALTTPSALAIPFAMLLAPAALVVTQPDLGTGMMIAAGGITVLFLAGLPWWWFAGGLGTIAAAVPILISHLHGYQAKRLTTFIDPSSDPLGAGYHITQSKIAIGSGGLFGKGFLQGTQSHLDYLPERHTDFVFATMAEEWGVAGGMFVLAGFGVILWWGMGVALRARTPFGRLTAAGLTMTLFFYVAINLLMVMGLAPVVGIPLPLVSYGGSAMMTVLLALGIMMSIAREADTV